MSYGSKSKNGLQEISKKIANTMRFHADAIEQMVEIKPYGLRVPKNAIIFVTGSAGSGKSNWIRGIDSFSLAQSYIVLDKDSQKITYKELDRLKKKNKIVFIAEGPRTKNLDHHADVVVHTKNMNWWITKNRHGSIDRPLHGKITPTRPPRHPGWRTPKFLEHAPKNAVKYDALTRNCQYASKLITNANKNKRDKKENVRKLLKAVRYLSREIENIS